MPSLGTADRVLKELLTDLRACRVCRDAPLGKPLPHEPRPVLRAARSATLCVAGQAPGTKVHATGLPFNDASGDRLRAWMAVDHDTFYDATRVAIVPMGFCFPGHDAAGGDLPPRRECVPLWRNRVMAELPRLRLILAIGGYAQRYHIGGALLGDVTETVSRYREVLASASANDPKVLPLPHPSWRNTCWLKRNPWFETDLLPVLRHEVTAALRSPAGLET